MRRVPDGILPGRHCTAVGLLMRLFGGLDIYILMHLHEEACYRRREPPLATKLEPAQMSTPVGRNQDSVGVTLELFPGYSFYGGNLWDVSHVTGGTWGTLQDHL